ncbi:MAG: hypothetical protein II348_05615 [Clostridia bacterium]|nr:hypothetical protein [Clostridia bacterium]
MKRWRSLAAIPIFPGILILGAMILGLPWVKILLLGLLAAAGTGVGVVVLFPKEDPDIPRQWSKDLKRLTKTVERIKNRSVYRGGRNVITELKQCQPSLPYLSPSARREITEYYLPTFLKYFQAYATFEECNEGNESILETMAQMEGAVEKIAENFRKSCDRNDRTATLNLNAQNAVLYKKLNYGEMDDE